MFNILTPTQTLLMYIRVLKETIQEVVSYKNIYRNTCIRNKM